MVALCCLGQGTRWEEESPTRVYERCEYIRLQEMSPAQTKVALASGRNQEPGLQQDTDESGLIMHAFCLSLP